MKYEWRKTEKAFYLPKEKGPVSINVPEMKFFVVDGAGSPADEEFQARIGLLYTLSYTIRMMPKSGWTPPDYQEYTVFPLEGVWRMDTDAWQGGALDKTKLKYNLMIRQPWFVTDEVAGRAMESARKKVPADLLGLASFESFTDGPSVQMLHVGPYDTEPETFAAMNAFLAERGLVRTEQAHREIYLSDPRRVSPEKNRTLLRFFHLNTAPGAQND
ncbi:MAG: GyrI-like domain-containing protein [Lentisphaeria bacterium]|nr:GyrI-like domain-containing protein [Lentisphaeria bacterium]